MMLSDLISCVRRLHVLKIYDCLMVAEALPLLRHPHFHQYIHRQVVDAVVQSLVTAVLPVMVLEHLDSLLLVLA